MKPELQKPLRAKHVLMVMPSIRIGTAEDPPAVIIQRTRNKNVTAAYNTFHRSNPTKSTSNVRLLTAFISNEETEALERRTPGKL